MKATQALHHKIMTLPQLLQRAAAWRVNGKTIAFTNGCFDLLHEGHVFSFEQAAATADYLVVGLNSDASVKRLKGPERPVNHEKSRALLISQLALVDAVVLFEEDTPLSLIEALCPDVLVKGGDYTMAQIVGAPFVLAKGGKVVINPLVEGYSTTGLIQKIKQGYS